MHLPEAICCVLLLWPCFINGSAYTEVSDVSCTTTRQSQDNKEVRCHFTPTTVILNRDLVPAVPSDVTQLDISNSDIGNLRLTTFIGLRSLRHLDLSHNKLTLLRLGHFADLQELTHLNLSNNHITKVGLNTFSANPKLQVLDLTKNMLRYFKMGTFNGLGNLQYLYLAKNNLYSNSLKPNLMRPLTGMVHINFSSNNMSAAPSRMLEAMTKLQSLILRKCSLQQIPIFIQSEYLKNMTHLVIANNDIRHVGKAVFSVMVNLEILALSENGMETIDVEALYALRNLREFYLNGNRITTIPKGMFRQTPKLEKIDLSRNDLSYLSSDLFWDTERLKTLNIQHNNLIKLGEGFDRTFKNGLQQFYIGYNPWDCRSFKPLITLMNIRKVDNGGFDGTYVSCKNYQKLPQD